jgi:two-component system response regulator HydG
MRTQKHILVVDDQPRLCLVLHRLLSREGSGWQVETVSSAWEALERLREAHFDLILTDLMMPEMNGIALTRAVRALDDQISVVWITAASCARYSQEAGRLGVHACLDKPARMDQIRATVREALETAERERV